MSRRFNQGRPKEHLAGAGMGLSQTRKRRSYFGPFHIDWEKRLLYRGGEPVSLTPKAFDTLLVLVENRGQTLAKDHLMKLLWPDSFVEEANLAQNISTLRRVLGESPNDHRYIVTVPGRGYRFVAEVTEASDLRGEETRQSEKEPRTHQTRIAIFGRHPRSGAAFREAYQNDADGELPADSAITPAGCGAATIPATRSTHSMRQLRLMLAAGILAIATVCAWAYASFFNRNDKPIDSLAVLPFANASGNADGEYLGDGITESLINNLSRLAQVRVIARTTVFRYKGQQIDPQQVGRDLKVRAVLTGKLTQQADTLVVQADLIDTTRGVQLWGGRYSRKLADIFTVEEEIAKEISEALRLRITAEQKVLLAKQYTTNAQAYQHYLRGRYYVNRKTSDLQRKAIESFNQAIEIDPNYALPYAGMADAYQYFQSLPAKERTSKAKAAARKALELDNMLAEAHTALARLKFWYDLDWDGAEREFKKAIELNPNYARAHDQYAPYLWARNRFEEAEAEFIRAEELDPLSVATKSNIGWMFFFMRQYDKAIAQFRTALDMDPSFAQAHLRLGDVYVQKRMYEEAIAELEKSVSLSASDPLFVATLGYAYGVAGKRDQALEIFERLKGSSNEWFVGGYPMALMYMGVGEKDRAIASLQRAYDETAEGLVTLRLNAVFDGLRSDPRFNDLLRRIGPPHS